MPLGKILPRKKKKFSIKNFDCEFHSDHADLNKEMKHLGLRWKVIKCNKRSKVTL